MAQAQIVSMFVGAHRRPTTQDTGERGEYFARVRRFAVESAGGVTFHGPWETIEEAQRFARTCPRDRAADGSVVSARAREVAPYVYVHGFGRLPEDSELYTAELAQLVSSAARA